ncbi:hypothetical protein LINPERPRIM_LOCUS20804 [Linum perenne]
MFVPESILMLLSMVYFTFLRKLLSRVFRSSSRLKLLNFLMRFPR